MAIECTYCEERVNAKRGVYVKCTTCQDIKLCLECFSAGATIAEHESDHPYELADCGSFSIIEESWRAHEELALLEAIELYGIGSWTDIANAVGTRTAEECSERYIRVYVDSFFGRCAWNAIEKDLYTVHDHTCAYKQPLSPSLFLPEKQKIVDINRNQQIRLGYMPKRDDFEREYDNEAEFLVSKLAVHANDDTELDQDLKIAHINMYTDKLRERFRRKRIVLEYNLVKLFFHMHPEENGDSDQQDAQSNSALDNVSQPFNSNSAFLENSTLPNNRNHNPANLNEFSTAQSAHPMQEPNSSKKDPAPIQNTILKYFHRIETTSASTATAGKSSTVTPDNSILSSYFSDLNKSIAEQDFNTMEKKLRIFCQFSSVEDHNRLIRNLAREKELKVKIKDLIRKRKNGHKFLNPDANCNDSDTNTAIKMSPSKKNSAKGNQSDNTEVSMDIDISSDNLIITPNKVTQRKNISRSESNKAIMNPHSNHNSEPGWRLLTESEKRLCKSSNLKPSQYITYKTSIMKERTSKKKKTAAQRLFTDDIDKTMKRKIADFLARNSWIKV